MIWYIALGSAMGGVARYLVDGAVQRALSTTFPAGTLLINISGSLLLGLIVRYGTETAALTPGVRAFLTIGLCGGYTTFSTFTYESATLLQDGEWARAGLYLVGSVILSLLAMLAGFALARELVMLRERI